jgi:hypothetical protein
MAGMEELKTTPVTIKIYVEPQCFKAAVNSMKSASRRVKMKEKK